MHSQQRLQVCSNLEKRIMQFRNYSKRMEQARLELEALGLGTCILQTLRNKASHTYLGPGLSFVCKPGKSQCPFRSLKEQNNSYPSVSQGFASIHLLCPSCPPFGRVCGAASLHPSATHSRPVVGYPSISGRINPTKG